MRSLVFFITLCFPYESTLLIGKSEDLLKSQTPISRAPLSYFNYKQINKS